MKAEVPEFVGDDDDLVLLGLTARHVDDARTALEKAQDVVTGTRAWIKLDDLQVVQVGCRLD